MAVDLSHNLGVNITFGNLHGEITTADRMILPVDPGAPVGGATPGTWPQFFPGFF